MEPNETSVKLEVEGFSYPLDLNGKPTTTEQWSAYYKALKEHEERVEREKPIPPPLYFTHYKPTPDWPICAETAQEAARIYQAAKRRWEMMASCDAPNKPGYYRANND